MDTMGLLQDNHQAVVNIYLDQVSLPVMVNIYLDQVSLLAMANVGLD